MKDDLLSALSSGALVLTANQRLARNLMLAHGMRQRAAGVEVWRTPEVMPLGAWLAARWNEYADEAGECGEQCPVVLGPAQELALWEQIVARSVEGEALFQVHATAQVALEAWNLSLQWRLHLNEDDPRLNLDAQAFLGWAKRYRGLCQARGWISGAELPDRVARLIREGVVAPPARVLLAGFDDLNPQQQALFEAMEEAGGEVAQLLLDGEEPKAVRVSLPDQEAEIAAAAQWARRLLERGAAGSIAVVVPELGAVRAKVERIFDDVLHPDFVLPGNGAGERAYNISLGLALARQPVVHAAFQILEMAKGSLPLNAMGGLLRSPFLAGAERELSRRALLDGALRRRGEHEVAPGVVRRLAEAVDPEGRPRPFNAPLLAQALARWQRVRRRVTEDKQPPSAWSALFSDLLSALGWPGERTLDSHEYQAVTAFRDLLDEFAALDIAVEEMDFVHALAYLHRLARNTLFQPKSEVAPVQVLGVLEASGMVFDYLWVLGLHDEVWPPEPRPNPFLPLHLQREKGLPHASAERELAFTRQVTRRLLQSAPTVVVSHPCREEDRDLRPSPLIQTLPGVRVEGLELGEPVSFMRAVHRTAALEQLEDEAGPPVAPGSAVAGGTGIFKQQAACPFRAFAQYRLGATALDAVRPGLDAAERGTVLHAALEQVWKELKSQENLCGLAPEELERIIATAARQAVEAVLRQRLQSVPQAFVDIEQRRIARLLAAWLETEKTRTPFMVVETEQWREIQVAGIDVRTKIDRIDQLPDGRQVVIDYKTGKPRLDDWFGDRPGEPQLPLYCVSNPERVAAVMFAQVRAGDFQFRGLAHDAEIAPGVKPLSESDYAERAADWEALLEEWRRVLEKLGEDFRAGRAPVDPKDGSKTCQYCELTPLCRIHEHDGLGVTEGKDGGDDI